MYTEIFRSRFLSNNIISTDTVRFFALIASASQFYRYKVSYLCLHFRSTNTYETTLIPPNSFTFTPITWQTECHPHTNMAKAALNMLTRTSAEDLAKEHRIYMNSVDTGWINDENPLEKASKIAKNNMFQTPIDEIDAAARILDPIFTGINIDRDGRKVYGKFLKDYKESEW